MPQAELEGRHCRFPLTKLPAMRLALQDAEFFQLLADIFLSLWGRGWQRSPRWPDRATHDDHAALEGRRILVAEQQPEFGQLVLQFTREIPIPTDTGVVKRDAEIGTDRAGRRVGTGASEANRRQQILDAGDHRECRPQRQGGAQDVEKFLAVEARLLHSNQIWQPLN